MKKQLIKWGFFSVLFILYNSYAQNLTNETMTNGVKEALSKGVTQGVNKLGIVNGFLSNPSVKIQMPDKLKEVEKVVRMFKQGKVADEFIQSMNRAAETAVPKAIAIFTHALSSMTIADAQTILSGPSDAGTQYFKKTSEEKLQQEFLPIVKDATNSVGVTNSYKKFIAKAGPIGKLLGKNAIDIDGYITQKAIDGLFKTIAEEEKNIRENPVAQTTEILKTVFGKK